MTETETIQCFMYFLVEYQQQDSAISSREISLMRDESLRVPVAPCKMCMDNHTEEN
jgi:hypothetical protein